MLGGDGRRQKKGGEGGGDWFANGFRKWREILAALLSKSEKAAILLVIRLIICSDSFRAMYKTVL